MDWFYFYNGGENSLLENANVTNKSFPVCLEINGKKRYSVFRSGFSLYSYSIKLPKRERCLYEMIRSHIPQKPYFDVDISLLEEKIFSRAERIAIAEQIPEILMDAIIKVRSEILYSDILVFNSHADDKRSFHIVVDRWAFLDSKQNKKFFESVMEYIPQQWLMFFDNTMYKSVQQFRLYMSTKHGKDRYKKLDPIKSRWIVEDDITDDKLNLRLFYASLVTKTDNCQFLEGYEEEQVSHYNNELIETESLSKIEQIISKLPDSGCYRIAEVKDHFIILRRLLPSKCIHCSKTSGYDRIHESDNPYVYLTSTGNVYFDCRRGSKFIIGNINDILYKEEIKVTKRKKIIEDVKIRKKIIDEDNLGKISPSGVDDIENMENIKMEDLKREINEDLKREVNEDLKRDDMEVNEDKDLKRDDMEINEDKDLKKEVNKEEVKEIKKKILFEKRVEQKRIELLKIKHSNVNFFTG